MRILSALSIGLLCVTTALAQLSVTQSAVVRLDGIESLRMVGDVALLSEAAEIKQTPCVLIEVETEAKNVEVQVSDVNRLPVQFRTVDKSTHLLSTPGKQWVEVVAIDFEANIFARKMLIVEVGDAPGPGPEPDDPDNPDPPPDPTGPYDGIAARVNAIVDGSSATDREAMHAVLSLVSSKMASFEWRQYQQALDYIQRNWPSCDKCAAAYNLIKADAAARNLSWQETVAYYREIAKGLK